MKKKNDGTTGNFLADINAGVKLNKTPAQPKFDPSALQKKKEQLKGAPVQATKPVVIGAAPQPLSMMEELALKQQKNTNSTDSATSKNIDDRLKEKAAQKASGEQQPDYKTRLAMLKQKGATATAAPTTQPQKPVAKEPGKPPTKWVVPDYKKPSSSNTQGVIGTSSTTKVGDVKPASQGLMKDMTNALTALHTKQAQAGGAGGAIAANTSSSKEQKAGTPLDKSRLESIQGSPDDKKYAQMIKFGIPEGAILQAIQKDLKISPKEAAERFQAIIQATQNQSSSSRPKR